MSAYFLSVVITESEQVVPVAVVQCFIVKFMTNENMKPAEILMRFRAQFNDEILLRIQLYDCSNSFKEDETEAENM
jgi:hypothetical protein